MSSTDAFEKISRWQKANTRQILLRFNIAKDADVLARLDSVESKTDYIRQLIRADIAASP